MGGWAPRTPVERMHFIMNEYEADTTCPQDKHRYAAIFTSIAIKHSEDVTKLIKLCPIGDTNLRAKQSSNAIENITNDACSNVEEKGKWYWIRVRNRINIKNLITSRGSPLVRAYEVWSTSINAFAICRADKQTQTHTDDRSTCSVQRRPGNDRKHKYTT